jgi:hypothetical protein
LAILPRLRIRNRARATFRAIGLSDFSTKVGAASPDSLLES